MAQRMYIPDLWLPVAALLALAAPAGAGTITADCTGMLDHDIYVIATDTPQQDVAPLGPAQVIIDDEAIVLTGAFGEYRFMLRGGTLYHNGSDTGLYCTYARRAG